MHCRDERFAALGGRLPGECKHLSCVMTAGLAHSLTKSGSPRQLGWLVSRWPALHVPQSHKVRCSPTIAYAQPADALQQLHSDKVKRSAVHRLRAVALGAVRRLAQQAVSQASPGHLHALQLRLCWQRCRRRAAGLQQLSAVL